MIAKNYVKVAMDCLNRGTMELMGLCDIYEENGLQAPTELKITYQVKTEERSCDYNFKKYSRKKSAYELFNTWVEACRHPKPQKQAVNRKKKTTAGITLKKAWEYKQTGLRGPMVSESGSIQEDQLLFALKEDKEGFYESHLIRLDLRTQQEKKLFTVKHLIRDIGVYENGRRYFTSFERKLYCMDDKTGKVIWEAKAGQGNTSWHIVMDEKAVYLFCGTVFCVDKCSGVILWECPEQLQHSNCTMAVSEKYLYLGTTGGAVPRWIAPYESGLLIVSDKGQVEYYQM